MKELILNLYEKNYIDADELLFLLENIDEENRNFLMQKANETRMKVYGNKVFMRGLIEFTNYCKNNCEYCGIRAQNKNIGRYRLELDEILACCEEGKKLGFNTFVLQGGEDPYFTEERMVEIIKTIKEEYPDCAITLSIGEKSYESYKKYYDAGADRYLLRHETASKDLYKKLHKNMSFETRIACLTDLKKIGFQVGAGFMIGIPGQTKADLVKDIMFLKDFDPHMVGIGPFIPHKDTPFNTANPGTVEDTITILAIIRLLLPNVLLPATTALGSIDSLGREKGLKAGANVVMPNLSPPDVRQKYSLYDGKVSTGLEAAESKNKIVNFIEKAGFSIDMSRGDYINWERRC